MSALGNAGSTAVGAAGAAMPAPQGAAGGAGTGLSVAGAGEPSAGSGGTPTTTPSLPAVPNTDGMGPFETMQDLASGPSGDSGVFWPTELGKDNIKHPAFVFGCGGSTTPTTYAELMSQIASHGFVVIAETAMIGDNGAPLKAAIDWLIAENARADSPFFGKLDTAHIALGGHSIGSANAFNIADDPRLTTSIHIAGGSLDMPGNINAPTTGAGGKRLVHPVAYVCSESDSFGNVEKTEKDYMNTTAPAWMTVMSGVDHIGAAREGMPAIIAWLRWQLAGESDRRAQFLDEGGAFNSGMYVSKNKNW
jgi:pimeloyl-ACP methyl ester carboxylesterase